MVDAATLRDALRLGDVADQELTAIFGTVFPLARWESNDRVNYFHSEQGHVLDVVYSRRGQILRFEPGPGLTDELVRELRQQVDAAFAQDAGVEVRRRPVVRHASSQWLLAPRRRLADPPGATAGTTAWVPDG